MLFLATIIVNNGAINLPTIEVDTIQQAMVIATDRIVGFGDARIMKIEEI